MKKFLIKSGVFLVLLASLSLLLFALFEKKLGTITNSYSLKRQQLESQAGSIEVLALGSSQSLHGVNPSYFSLKGYNIGNSAQTLFYDAAITLKYIDKMPRLKYVFIAVSDFSLGFQLFDNQEKWRDYFYAQCWDIKFPEIKSTDLYLHSKILLYTPEKSLGYALRLFHVNLVENYYPDGWARMTDSSDINDQNGFKEAQLHNTFCNPKRYPEIRRTLDTLLTALEKKGITPVFFTPPVTSCYFKYLGKEKQEIMQTTIAGFCGKYKCRYFNYQTDSRFLFSDFADCDHLNSSGAEKLSKLLNSDILLKDKK